MTVTTATIAIHRYLYLLALTCITLTASLRLPLEVRPARALVPGTSRGFHPAVTVHTQDFLGRWTARFHEVKLYGGIVAVGEYYARIKVGGQTIRVQIDTGSSTLAFPMQECTSCKKGDMRYDMAKSNSGQARIVKCTDHECQTNRCNSFICGACSTNRQCCATSDHSACAFHLSFGDGSGARGVLVNDVLEWGDVKFPVTFGGIRHDSPDFERKQVDGIMGMAYPRLACNPSCVKPAWESARDFLKLDDLFTICMTDDGGTITLGEFDDRINTTAVTWVPMRLTNPPQFYNMQLLGNLKIGTRELVFPSYYRAIMDSGTTLVVFSKHAFKLFMDHLKTHYCHIPGLCSAKTWFRPAHCVKISDKDRLALPTLEFQLEGFKITLTPNEYMINYKSKGPLFWCVGIMALDTMSGGVDVIFGNTVMKKYITIYDRANKRIGFAECGGNCDVKHTSTAETAELPTKSDPNGVPKLHNGLEPILGASENSTAPSTSTSTDGATVGKTPTSTVVGTNGVGEHKQNAGSVQSSVALCGTAKDCSACAELGSRNCFWDTPLSSCLPGSPTKLMCAIDSIVGHLAYVVLGIIVGIIVVLMLAIIAVWAYRKRRARENEQKIDAAEHEETLQPLQENDDDVNEIFG